MTNPTAAMLVIGDEILSGRTRDANMYHLAGELTKIGIILKEVRVVSDEAAAIVAAVDGDLLAAGSVFVRPGQRTIAVGAVVVARAFVALALLVLLAVIVLLVTLVLFFLHDLAAEVAIFVDAALNFRLND